MSLTRARIFATKAHQGQMYGSRPYHFHLERVVDIAERHDLSKEIRIACWLHDTLEDCDVKYRDIVENFGMNVAEMVYAVTDELGRNRKERKLKTYPKIKAIPGGLEVKLCDRIANLEQSILDNLESHLSMYLREHTDFRENLFENEQDEKVLRLWNHLEALIQKARAQFQ